MFKEFRITVVLVLLSSCLFSQSASIKSQILESDDSKSVLISKGRKLLLDKFAEGDLAKVQEIKDYLIENEDDNYFAFYPAEYWYILFWTKDYAELAESIQSFDSVKAASYNANVRIRPSVDMLFAKLRDKSYDDENDIVQQLLVSDLDPDKKQALLLVFDWLLMEKRQTIYAQDSLNAKADIFLETYATSGYSDFTKKYIRYRQVPKDWGVTFEFFSGYSVFTGALSDSYTNNIPIGIAFDICYKDFELYLRDYIGFNKTKKDMVYSVGTRAKASTAMVYLPEASLGYVVYNTDRLKVSPFAGIGSMSIAPPSKDTEETPELEEVTLDFTTTYIAGVNFDIKLGDKNPPKYAPKASYGFVRIRYGYNIPRFENKYDGMSGTMHYITIGWGGMARGVKRAD